MRFSVYQQHVLLRSWWLRVGVSKAFGPGAILRRLCLKRTVAFRPVLVLRRSLPFGGKQDMQRAMDKLPRGAEICVVEGGNNRGFASYSRQPLDWEVREDLKKCQLSLNACQATTCLTAL